jgi:hypothetical protein
MAEEILTAAQEQLEGLEIYRCYKRSKFLSIKHSSYFQVYEDLLSKYRGRKIIFVEIGVLNGGSLFMWREFLGPAARIIGIDATPEAKKWEQEGFEIYIGDQSDEKFWNELFSTIGNVDIVLDDGGHANEQQIVTAENCVPHINDDGLLVVEDTHTSYMTSFGNPSKYSFINYCKRLIDSINSRSPSVDASRNELNRIVSSIELFESIVCMRINRTKCLDSSLLSNEGISSDARDFRAHTGFLNETAELVRRRFPFLERVGGLKIAHLIFSIRAKYRSRNLSKYFR